MKAEELRLRNLIEFDGNHFEVSGIQSHLISIIKYNFGGVMASTVYMEFVKGIPLTEVFLLQCDFIEIKKLHGTQRRYEKNGFKISISNSGNFYSNRKQILYVHKLQNLYFELNDEELTLKN